MVIPTVRRGTGLCVLKTLFPITVKSSGLVDWEVVRLIKTAGPSFFSVGYCREGWGTGSSETGDRAQRCPPYFRPGRYDVPSLPLGTTEGDVEGGPEVLGRRGGTGRVQRETGT